MQSSQSSVQDIAPAVDSGRDAVGLRVATPQRTIWHGASGDAYIHHVHTLIGCPPVPACNYLLVRRNSEGRADVLYVGRGIYDAPTLNLARIRHRGAVLGANEVHVLLDAGCEIERQAVQLDLQADIAAARR